MYRLEPQRLGDNAWYYEEKGGLIVYTRQTTINKHAVIPWSKLRASLKRHDEALAKKQSQMKLAGSAPGSVNTSGR